MRPCVVGRGKSHLAPNPIKKRPALEPLDSFF